MKKRALSVVLALCMELALLALPALAEGGAPPAQAPAAPAASLAGSETTPALAGALEVLESLQKGDVAPQWEPDVKANQARIQALLELVKQFTGADRQALTPAEREGLRAYLGALYALEGRDPGELEGMLEAAAPSPTEEPPAPTAAPTEAATAAPTAAPTEAPEGAATAVPTQAPDRALVQSGALWVGAAVAALLLAVLLLALLHRRKKSGQARRARQGAAPGHRPPMKRKAPKRRRKAKRRKKRR